MKKIIFFISVLLFPFMVSASSLYEDIKILPNGDVLVKESISIDGNYNGFELSLGYKYYDENKIYSADDMIIEKICESEKSNPLEDIKNCFTEVSSASKGESLKYTKSFTSKGYTLRLYNPSSRNKSFYIEYLLKNVIVQHNDVNELKLNLLDYSMNESFDNVEVKVSLPEKSVDLRAWAHGPLWGSVKLDENKEYATFMIDDYDANTAVDIRMTFDKSLVTTSKVTNVDKLDSIISEETERANAANEERERAKEYEEELRRQKEAEAKKFAELSKKMNKVLAVLSSVWLAVGAFLFSKFYKNNDKEYTPEFTGKYFRDFPSNHSPEIVEYLMNKNISTNALSTSILNIVYKKGFKVNTIKRTKGLLIKKEVDDYEFIFNNSNLKEELTESEDNLRSWLVSDYGDGSKFVLSSLEKVNRSESAARKFLNKVDNWKKTAIKEAEKENFYEKSSGKCSLVLFSCIPFIMILVFMPYNPLVLILGVVGMAFIIYVLSANKRTREGNELYAKWNGLKNFIKDFGSFKDKELPEIALWEKYLVYAHIFGLAENLRKQMEIKLPEITDSTDLDMVDYMIINRAVSNSITSSVSAAVSSANSKIASSEASSGGGYGGGFSSGGGFSGGGGSGGGRF